MKKIIFLFCLGLIKLEQEIHSQQKLEVGIGINHTFLNSNNINALKKYNSSYSYSFFVDYYFYKYKKISFGTSVGYISRSFDVNFIVGGSSWDRIVNAKFSIGYLGYSLYPEIIFGNKLKWGFSIRPEINAYITGNQTGENYIYLIPTHISENISLDKMFSKLLFNLSFNIKIIYSITDKFDFTTSGKLEKGINSFVAGSSLLNSSIYYTNTYFLCGIRYKL
ncbi:MAG: hypothetical protein N2662_03165 [Bacteroidales bacterium]|nr:hypothetical protein [Bacteroidales bacterium]